MEVAAAQEYDEGGAGEGGRNQVAWSSVGQPLDPYRGVC